MTRQHRWTAKLCHWEYCSVCGLMALKNKASRRSADQECPGETRVRVQVMTPGEIRQLKKLDKLIWE